MSTDRERAIRLIGDATKKYDDGQELISVSKLGEAQIYAFLDIASAIRELEATVRMVGGDA